MKIRKTIVSVILLTLFCITAHAAESDLTPQPGDPLRKQLLDALRKEVKVINGMEVVFVVKHLKVKDGWAWVHTLPQSPDGKNRYEDLSALMQLKDGNWQVAEIPCGEVDNPECLDGPDYFKRLRVRYPGISVELLPDYSTKPE